MRRQATAAGTFLFFFTLTAIAAPTPRQQEVAKKGAMVMPFNVHNSTHVFQKNPSGGIQQVVAKDPNDKDLVAAIRTHLEMEAERFGKGDYSDPMKIHGKGMPGGAISQPCETRADRHHLPQRTCESGGGLCGPRCGHGGRHP